MAVVANIFSSRLEQACGPQKLDPTLIPQFRLDLPESAVSRRPSSGSSPLIRKGPFLRLLSKIVPVVLDALAFARNLLRSRSALAAENLFLRKQLTFFIEREQTPRRTDNSTRFTMVTLAKLFEWRNSLIVVKPDTLIRWHRKGFRLFWRWKSRRKGRPPVPEELKKLIVKMAFANVSWGEERIAHELLVKLGVRVSPRTVRKYMPNRDHGGRGAHHSSQRWATFVRNHAKAIIAADFLTVVTARFQFLYVLVVMEVGTRKIVRDHAPDRGVDLAAVPRSDTLRARLPLRDRRPRYQVLRRSTEVRASDGRQGVEDARIRAASEFLLRETDRQHPPRVFGLPHPALGKSPSSSFGRMA